MAGKAGGLKIKPERLVPVPERRRGRGGGQGGGRGHGHGHGHGRGRAGRSLFRLLYWCAVAGVWLTIALAALGVYYAHDLPDVSDLPPPGQDRSMVVRAANGATLASYGAIYGDWLAYPDIPEVIVLALVAAEDRRFFHHFGVDARGIARAAVANLRVGGVAQGGSTLTQQLAKNLFLEPERTLKRKAQELLLAFWLERKFTKQQILELYFNRIYFGAGTFGIDAASRKYFGHSARQLSLQEAAMLAGLVKAPSALAPTRDPARAQARAGQVLDAMVAVEFLTEAAAERAKAEPAALAPDAVGSNIRYFTDWVQDQVRQLVGERSQPLIVETTIDPKIQAAADQALTRTLADQGTTRQAGQGAIVTIATDGAVKAMSGGVAYGKSQFNRAVQAKRQPGSAFKLFVYLAGLEAGLNAASVLDDAPITVDGWQPRNYGDNFIGPVTLADAFARSINSVAVRVSEQAGRLQSVELAKRLGIASPLIAHPSVALGTSEVSLLELTAAYGAVANGGFRVDPYAVVEVRTLAGELLYRRAPTEPEAVLAPREVAEISVMLEQVIRTGTGRRAVIDRPAAGKTGTSQEFRDAYFVGFTSDLVGGVWVGNDDGSPMKGVTGGGLPAEIWASAMIDAHVGTAVRPLLADRFVTRRRDEERRRTFLDRIESLFGRD